MVMRNSYTVLVRKLEGKKLLDRHRCRWEKNVKMHAKEIRFACKNSI